MQCSKEEHKANCSQPKTPASKGKPQQAKAADAALAEFAGEASRIHSPSDLILITPGTQTQGPYDPTQAVATHYRAHRVPVQQEDNSVVWSEGVGVCWFEPMLQGSPAPLVRFSNVLYVPQLASNLLSLFTLTALSYTFTGTGHSLAFSKDGQVLFQAMVSGCCIGKLLGRTLLLATRCLPL